MFISHSHRRSKIVENNKLGEFQMSAENRLSSNLDELVESYDRETCNL